MEQVKMLTDEYLELLSENFYDYFIAMEARNELRKRKETYSESIRK